MPVTLSADGTTYENTANLSDAPAVSITGNNVTLINLATLSATSAAGAVIISGSGAVIDNRFGASILAGSSNWDAIVGSGFADMVINTGTITGTVALGEGNDTYVQRFSSPSASATLPNLSGGGGEDVLRIEGTFGQIFAPSFMTGIESVIIDNAGGSGGFNIAGLNGVSSIETRGTASANITASNSPNATLTVGGGYVGLGGGVVIGQVRGGAEATSFTLFGGLAGAPTISNGIDLGGGDDVLMLHLDFHAPSAVPLPSLVNLGEGYDRLVLIDRSHDRDIDLAQIAGLEEVNDFGNIGPNAVTLRGGGAGLERVVLRDRPVTLTGFQSPYAVIEHNGDVLNIAAGSLVGSLRAYGSQSLAAYTAFAYAAGNETTVTNLGEIVGDVWLGYSNDRYDGQSGVLGGTVQGFAGDDVLNGGAGTDRFDGGQGADSLSGFGGDDSFILGTALAVIGDRIDGGSGTDTIELRAVAGQAAHSAEYQVQALSQHVLASPASVTGVERLAFAGGQMDAVSGAFSLTAFAAGGIAEVSGSAGVDVVVVATGGAGSFTMPSPVLANWAAAGEIASGVPTDAFMLIGDAGPGGSLTLNASATLASRQILIGGASNDTLNGSAQADILEGRGGADTLRGGDGNDELRIINEAQPTGTGGYMAPTLYSGAGSTFDGGNGSDVLAIGGYVQFQGTLTSIEGVRLLRSYIPFNANTPMRPEAVLEIDAARLAQLAPNAVISGTGTLIVRAAAGQSASFAALDTAQAQGIAFELIGSTGNESLTGTQWGDFLDGGSGDDSLIGGFGDDLLTGGAGADSLNGGSGRDIASYIAASAAIAFDLTSAPAGAGDAAGDSFTDIEVFVGSGFHDLMAGGAASDELWGADGNDFLRGRGGADSLYGGAGLDNLEGGAGADWLDGSEGFDIASYGNAVAGLRASLADRTVNTGDAAGDRYVGVEGLSGSFFGDDLIGNGAANSLWGAQGEDVLWGQGGNDELYGNEGNDWLIGGTGADKLDGGAGWDTVRYSFAASGLRADLQDWWGNTGDAAGDRTFEVENLVGSDWNDLLLGDGGANELWGDYGDDHLWGRGGNDWLAGGNGLDTFHFTQGWGADTVLDFGAGGAEKLSFDGIAGLTSFSQLTVTSGAAGVTISFGGNSILLQGVASIAAGDCIFA